MRRAAAWLLALAACKSATQTEAERIVSAIERVEHATPEGRGPVIDALEKEHAEGELAERARAACARAYRAMHDAKTKIASVEERMKKDAGPPDASILADFVEAQKSLEDAQASMPACRDAVRELRLTVH